MEKFKLGQMVATWDVDHLMRTEEDFKTFVFACLERYRKCDWGDLEADDKELNNEAVNNGVDRILASYNHTKHPLWRIWIITEADRSATTILFPHEY